MSEEPSSRRSRRRPPVFKILLMLVVLGALGAGYLFWNGWSSTPTTPDLVAVPVTRGDLDILVESSGTAKAAQSMNLQFQATGKVNEVLVKPGDRVKAGQQLARVDDRELVLQVQQTEANLKTAEATLEKALDGSATPQDLAQAEANLRAAQAQLDGTRTGKTTAADIRQAEANLRAAQAQLESTRSGKASAADIRQAEASLRAAEARLDAVRQPSSDKVSAAELALTQAQLNLETTRNTLSADKTNAQLRLQQAADALIKAQSAYSTAKWNWEFVEETGADPNNPTTVGEDGQPKPNKLSDTQRQQYRDAFVQAEATMRSAEADVTQSQVNYDAARQKEVVGVQEAEAQVANAQKQLDAVRNPDQSQIAEAQAAVDQARAALDKLREGGTRSEVAAAQAQVDQARAALDKLREGGTRSEIAGAQAQVDQARAQMEKLTAPMAKSDVKTAEATVAQAQTQIAAAKLKLANATLTAPFEGTIATVDIIPGSIVDAAGAAMTIIDTSSMHLDVKLSEVDVARVKTGQDVNITFYAISTEKTFSGKVLSVAPTATEQQNVVTYLVRVQFDPGQEPVKVGMTAGVAIVVDHRDDVILVPSNAIKTQGGTKTVQVLYGANKTPVTVHVETGATNGSTTEIVRCLDTGNQCLKEGDQLGVAPSGAATEGGPEEPGIAPAGPIRPIEGGGPPPPGQAIPVR
ncbi:MAG TPA: HlyD family efflux transporter periplasmic adaptor subunit [Herpetosiphonaceae bacterium]